MAFFAAWLLAASAPLYPPYEAALGTSAALHDQRVAGVIMLAAALPAFAVALALPPIFGRPAHAQFFPQGGNPGGGAAPENIAGFTVAGKGLAAAKPKNL